MTPESNGSETTADASTREIQVSPSARLGFALMGAAAGLSGWLLVDRLADVIGSARLYLFLVVLAAVFFSSVLAMMGPLPTTRAVNRAALLALLVAVLVWWAGWAV